MAELVSILIPAYNAETWLNVTLRSALAQTWPRTEVIVVDDGSRDRTLEVAKAFERGSVKVVSQPNMGAPAARNAAFQLAQGDYIQWLDADDLLDPDKISAQMRIAHKISNPRMLLSASFGTFYYRPEKAIFTRTSLWQDLDPIQYFLTRFNENVYFQTDAWLVSRELSAAAGPWTDFDSPDDDGEYLLPDSDAQRRREVRGRCTFLLPNRQRQWCEPEPLASSPDGTVRVEGRMHQVPVVARGQCQNA